MHEGGSALEIETACDVRARAHDLDKLLTEVIARVLRRCWGGKPLDTITQAFSMMQRLHKSILCAPGGGVTAKGDFSITVQLLVAKDVY